MKPTTAAVDELKAFPFLSDKLEYLMLELPMYIAAAEDVSHTTDVLEWWKSNESKLPHSADRSMEACPPLFSLRRQLLGEFFLF